MPTFLSCLSDTETGTRSSEGQGKALLDPLDSDGYRPGCVFCNVSRQGGFDVVRETEDMIAFRDRYVAESALQAKPDARSPQAETHLLIIPRKHLGAAENPA